MSDALQPLTATRVAVLIDGSNFLNELDRAGLGFPSLEPLVRMLSAPDNLLFARFYAAAPNRDWSPHYQNWQRFTAANRAVPNLSFVPGYRNKAGKEKGVDVALSVDLTIGACHKHFDRAVVVTADGDMKYAIKQAVSHLAVPVTVALIDGLTYAGLAKSFAREGAAIFPLKVADLISLGVCALGRYAHVPVPTVLAATVKDAPVAATESADQPSAMPNSTSLPTETTLASQ